MTIAGRQFRSYFNGPAAYIVICLVLMFVGGFFWFYFFLEGRAVAVNMFLWLGRSLLFAAPALTMGLLAEERRSGTLELLVSLPVRESEVIIGKFLGAFGLYLVLVALTFVHPIAVASLGDLDWGPVFSGYFGIILLGAAMIALGLMASAWTNDQLIAFFVAFAIMLVLYLVPIAFRILMSGTLATFVDFIGLEEHVRTMARGLIELRAVIYLLSLTIIGLMAAFRALESRRWS
ncbi:MAG: ABC transporter permease [Sandaracinaceae bacterium]